jgi:hypothetical protein
MSVCLMVLLDNPDDEAVHGLPKLISPTCWRLSFCVQLGLMHDGIRGAAGTYEYYYESTVW